MFSNVPSCHVLIFFHVLINSPNVPIFPNVPHVMFSYSHMSSLTMSSRSQTSTRRSSTQPLSTSHISSHVINFHNVPVFTRHSSLSLTICFILTMLKASCLSSYHAFHISTLRKQNKALSSSCRPYVPLNTAQRHKVLKALCPN